MTIQGLRFAAVLGVGAILLGTTVEADAHAQLVKAATAAEAVVGSPNTIMVEFNEVIEGRFSSFDLITQSGAKIPLERVMLDAKTRKVLSASPQAPLAPGPYTVAWHAVSDDGHKVEGSYGFTVK